MRVFFAIFFTFSLVFLTFFGMSCFYGYTFPIKFEEEVSSACETFDVEKDVVFSIINVESHFRPNCVSKKGAVGLMQVLPSTAQDICGQAGLENFDLYEPVDNIFLGTFYISKLIERFGDLNTAISAYNAGPTNVSKWLKDENFSADGKTLKKIPFPETENYVKKFQKNLSYYSKKIKK